MRRKVDVERAMSEPGTVRARTRCEALIGPPRAHRTGNPVGCDVKAHVTCQDVLASISAGTSPRTKVAPRARTSPSLDEPYVRDGLLSCRVRPIGREGRPWHRRRQRHRSKTCAIWRRTDIAACPSSASSTPTASPPSRSCGRCAPSRATCSCSKARRPTSIGAVTRSSAPTPPWRSAASMGGSACAPTSRAPSPWWKHAR